MRFSLGEFSHHKITPADGRWCLLFAFVAWWSAAAEFWRYAQDQMDEDRLTIDPPGGE